MKIIDTHCHLYAEEFTGDIDAVVARAVNAGVDTFYLPGIDSNSIGAMLALEERFPGQCKAMMGLHPCYVKENYQAELAIVRQWLEQRRFAAVGEIGLDFYWDKTFTAEQHDAFRTQVEWSLEFDLPIVIHTRNAMQETINVVKAYTRRGVRGIFHCFSGSRESAEQIIAAGFYLGIGGVLTYKNAGLPEALAGIDVAHLVLETDSPYLAPLPFRGKRNESSYLVHIIDKLAAVKGMPVAELAAITTANAQKIFGGY